MLQAHGDLRDQLVWKLGAWGLWWGYIRTMEKKMDTTIMGLYIGLGFRD